MKKGLFLALIIIAMMAGSVFAGGAGGGAGGADIIPWSHTNNNSQVFSFHLPFNSVSYNVRARIDDPAGKKSYTSTLVEEDKRLEVEIKKEGDYVIKVCYNGREYLTSDMTRDMSLNIEYPVTVGKIFFVDHFRMHMAGDKIGYTFIVYPQFGYSMPSRIDAEISIGDIVKKVSFNCGQNYLQSYGYCETGIVEMSAFEYQEQVAGDTYTCFKTADTKSCRIMRYYNFVN